MTDKIFGLETDPTLTDLILEAKRDVKYSINCVQLGTIESYSRTTNMASVSVNFKRKLADGTLANYPVLAECPVFIPSGGSSCLTFPIAKGDQCIILFNDRNIDNWYLKGEVKEPATSRCHDIADGIVLVGVRNLITAATAAVIPANSACLNGGTKKVAVKNAVTDLKTLIDSLITILDGFITVGSATTQTTSPATQALLATLKAQFATLLDEGLT
jgi:hypothetical protein